MTKPTNTESIERSTGKKWGAWINTLDKAGGRNLTHSELAQKAIELLGDTVKNPSWWAQTVAVAYEQYIGRREPGQLANGLYEITTSKTIHVSRSDLFEVVVEWLEHQTHINNKQIINPRSSITLKRSAWRCDFIDTTKFAATVEGDDNKSKLVLSHTAIPTKEDADNWKEFWQATIKSLEHEVQ